MNYDLSVVQEKLAGASFADFNEIKICLLMICLNILILLN